MVCELPRLTGCIISGQNRILTFVAVPEIFQQIPTDETNDLSRTDLFLKQTVYTHGFCQSSQGVIAGSLSIPFQTPLIPHISLCH